MKITVLVKPNCKKESVEQLPDGTYVVRANAAPIENKANERVLELLSENLKIKKSSIQLVSGHHGKKKIFKIG